RVRRQQLDQAELAVSLARAEVHGRDARGVQDGGGGLRWEAVAEVHRRPAALLLEGLDVARPLGVEEGVLQVLRPGERGVEHGRDARLLLAEHLDHRVRRVASISAARARSASLLNAVACSLRSPKCWSCRAWTSSWISTPRW